MTLLNKRLLPELLHEAVAHQSELLRPSVYFFRLILNFVGVDRNRSLGRGFEHKFLNGSVHGTAALQLLTNVFVQEKSLRGDCILFNELLDMEVGHFHGH